MVRYTIILRFNYYTNERELKYSAYSELENVYNVVLKEDVI